MIVAEADSVHLTQDMMVADTVQTFLPTCAAAHTPQTDTLACPEPIHELVQLFNFELLARLAEIASGG